MRISHIALTTDMSPESLAPAGEVGALARTMGARVTLLCVVEELRIAPHGAPLAPPVAPPDSQSRVEEARKALEGVKGRLGGDLEVVAEVVRAEKVAVAVAEFAVRNGVDLVCLSTHGRTGFKHLALGSVAEAILRHSKVPVLAFPLKG